MSWKLGLTKNLINLLINIKREKKKYEKNLQNIYIKLSEFSYQDKYTFSPIRVMQSVNC